MHPGGIRLARPCPSSRRRGNFRQLPGGVSPGTREHREVLRRG